MSVYEAGDEVTQLPCKHHYHLDCVTAWLKDNSSCPICRHEMPKAAKDEAVPAQAEDIEGPGFLPAFPEEGPWTCPGCETANAEINPGAACMGCGVLMNTWNFIRANTSQFRLTASVINYFQAMRQQDKGVAAEGAGR